MEKIYILTTVNEEYGIVDTKAYKSLDDAQEVMKSEFNREAACFHQDFEDENFIEESLSEHSAQLSVDHDGDVILYYWNIATTVLK